MNQKSCFWWLLLCIIIIPNPSNAQFGKLLKKTTDKVLNKMGDQVSERIADEIVKSISKSFNTRMDSVMQEYYKSDTTLSEVDYSVFLQNMDKSNEVPEEYTFDLSTEIQLTDDKGKESVNMVHYSKSLKIFGFTDENQTVVIDNENQIYVIYDIEEKTASAIPNMLDLYKPMMQAHIDTSRTQYEIKQEGKSKKVAGYKSTRYLIKDLEKPNEHIEAYFSTDFPIEWETSLMAMLDDEMIDKSQMGELSKLEGMLMQSTSYEDGSVKDKYKIISVDNTIKNLKKVDYTFSSLNNQN